MEGRKTTLSSAIADVGASGAITPGLVDSPTSESRSAGGIDVSSEGSTGGIEAGSSEETKPPNPDTVAVALVREPSRSDTLSSSPPSQESSLLALRATTAGAGAASMNGGVPPGTANARSGAKIA